MLSLRPKAPLQDPEEPIKATKSLSFTVPFNNIVPPQPAAVTSGVIASMVAGEISRVHSKTKLAYLLRYNVL